ncbi:hypothetical protein PBRA_003326 [Plasmodiophora brassicae]|uniref:Reverse transcriptase RNase H-like domain-containing protein n=1 Tax=Plasmodiophora brassicae TaxID=37360 RepID=A0A0G4J8P7_PLABS|nr:hypothetical protein PBRA_003326 [Plasmodiophora brassicae]
MIGSGASAPVLAHFNPDRSCEVETDASDFAIAMVLSQRDADDRQRPLAFDSRRLTKEELNYKMHDKEMLAIVQSFEKWRQLLDSARHQTLAHSDHRDLEYFLSTPKLSRRQARWSESLGEFDFRIRHRPGRLHGKADALSRRPVHQPSRAEEETIQRSLPMLSPDHFLPGPLGHTISALRQEANREPLIERIRRQQATVARGLVRGSAGKRVRLSVKASRAVLDAEIEFTQRFGPPRLTPGKFRRAQEVLEVPVIAVDQGLVARQIEELAPLLERLDNRQHLRVVHLVVELLLRQPTRGGRGRAGSMISAFGTTGWRAATSDRI